MSSLSRIPNQPLRRPRHRKAGAGSASRFPPKISLNPIFTKTFRFECNSAEAKGSLIVSTNCLRNLMYTTLGSTTGRSIFSSTRLRAVSCWSVPSVTGWQQAQIVWFGNNNPNVVLDAFGDASRPATITSKPPKNSFASEWSGMGQTNYDLFSLAFGTTGAIIDVTINYTLFDYDGSVVPSTLTLGASAAAGYLSYNYLDNSTKAGGAGTNYCSPQGVTTELLAYGAC